MALSVKDKILLRERRKKRVRKKILGTSDKPRLCVYKSNRYIYAQLVDDTTGVTLAFASSLKFKKEEEDKINYKSIKDAKKVGEEIGKIAAGKGIKRIVFDRSGYPYHGRLKALADAVREQGIKF